MRLEDLDIPSISSLSDEDALKLILEVRSRRRMKPEKQVKLVNKKSQNKLDKFAASLSKDQLAELLSLLTKG